MAQKVNPIAVRLKLNRSSDSCWFSDYYYAQLLYQDINFRGYFNSIRPPIGPKIGFRPGRCVLHHYPKRSVIHVFCLGSKEKQHFRPKNVHFGGPDSKYSYKGLIPSIMTHHKLLLPNIGAQGSQQTQDSASTLKRPIKDPSGSMSTLDFQQNQTFSLSPALKHSPNHVLLHYALQAHKRNPNTDIAPFSISPPKSRFLAPGLLRRPLLTNLNSGRDESVGGEMSILGGPGGPKYRKVPTAFLRQGALSSELRAPSGKKLRENKNLNSSLRENVDFSPRQSHPPDLSPRPLCPPSGGTSEMVLSGGWYCRGDSIVEGKGRAGLRSLVAPQIAPLGLSDNSPSIYQIHLKLRTSGWLRLVHDHSKLLQSSMWSKTGQNLEKRKYTLPQSFFSRGSELGPSLHLPVTPTISSSHPPTPAGPFKKSGDGGEMSRGPLRPLLLHSIDSHGDDTSLKRVAQTSILIDTYVHYYIMVYFMYLRTHVNVDVHCHLQQIKKQIFEIRQMTFPLNTSRHSYLSNIQSTLSIHTNTFTSIIPIKVTSVYQSASLMAQEIACKLEQAKSFRQICRSVFQHIEICKHIKGIRISCSGRLNGAEIAKTECRKYGETSLHVFSEKIDYAQTKASTPYGLLGVKVWISYF